MEFKVTTKYLRISPRKVRPVLYGLRGMNVEAAKNAVYFTNKKAAGFIYDLIKAGIAAAKENYAEPEKVTIKSIACNEGPRLKRMQPWSKGQSRRITKRMSHITLVLEAPDEVKTEKPKAKTENNKEQGSK